VRFYLARKNNKPATRHLLSGLIYRIEWWR